MKESRNIKTGIVGAAGRMGAAIVRCLHCYPRLFLAGALESDQCPDLGKDAGVVAGIEPVGVIISSDMRDVAGKVEVLVDFSAPEIAAECAAIAAEMKIGMVTGTTGLDSKQESALRKAAESTPIVRAPNMSKGMNLLFDLVKKAAGVLRDYDVEIIETHHKHKKDAPSGTALRLVEAAAAARNPEPIITHGRRGRTNERPANEIGVHAVRAGDVAGDHVVVLASDGERIELTHRASSRDCFAMGALQAAEWVAGRKPGLYTMQHVLDLVG